MAGIYMKYDGIEGPVTTAGFEKCIELESCSWGFQTPMDQATEQYRGAARVREVTITKKADAASTWLVQSGLDHGKSATVKISFTSTNKDKVDTYLSLELSECLISSYSLAHDGKDKPLETVALNYTKISFAFVSRDAKLTGKPMSYTYDLKKG